MLDILLKNIAPHHCYRCQTVGKSLCEDCKNYIVSEPFCLCLSCLAPTVRISGLCTNCKRYYSRAWCVGGYDGIIKDSIAGLKFERNKEVAKDLSDLLDARIPSLPTGVVVTYVPTTSSRRRQRGYDQSRLIALGFARKRGLKLSATLIRKSGSHQRGSNAKQRWRNAQFAYDAKNVQPKTYLLIDDVMTSGATFQFASKALRDAGASDVWIACVARQTLD